MKRVLPPVLLLLMAAGAALWLFPRITMKQLTIVTVPRGAVFYINGVPGGLTPAVRLVPSDGLHLSAARDGFFPRDTLLEATPDTVFLQLTQGCLLVVNTIPTDCHIEAGNFSGSSPCSLIIRPGNPVEVTARGPMGLSVTRTVNVLSSDVKLLNITVPFYFTDTDGGMEFVVIPSELMPFAMGPMTVGRDEVTAGDFAAFMNEMDPGLLRDSHTIRGRTLLMDSILRSNWNGPISFNDDTTAYSPVPGMETHPVTGVTQEGAALFCSWLSERSGSGLDYRLPDPVEWAILAGAGEDIPVNLSDETESILGRHPDINDGWPRTAPAGAMGYSEWGLGHMGGNVWEWTSDTGVAAGGSWISSRQDCRPDALIELDETLGYPFTGFRVVATGAPESIIQEDHNRTEMEL